MPVEKFTLGATSDGWSLNGFLGGLAAGTCACAEIETINPAVAIAIDLNAPPTPEARLILTRLFELFLQIICEAQPVSFSMRFSAAGSARELWR